MNGDGGGLNDPAINKGNFGGARAVFVYGDVHGPGADQLVIRRQVVGLGRHGPGARFQSDGGIGSHGRIALVHVVHRHRHRIDHRRQGRIRRQRLGGQVKEIPGGLFAQLVIPDDLQRHGVQIAARVRQGGERGAKRRSDVRREALAQPGQILHLDGEGIERLGGHGDPEPVFIAGIGDLHGFRGLRIAVLIHPLGGDDRGGDLRGLAAQGQQQAQRGDESDETFSGKTDDPFHTNDASFGIHRVMHICFNYITIK